MKKAISKLLLVSVIILSSGGITHSQNVPVTDKDSAVKAISDHFVNVPSMTGEFIQFGPNGEQTGGKFYINRPGKIRFNYEDPSPIMVVSNGRTLAVNNKKLKTWNYYPLRNTPLSLLLADEIDINDGAIKSVTATEDLTTVVMGDETIFGDSEITLLFDAESQDLRQWTIRDAQGKETSVMIFNVEKNIAISDDLFEIDVFTNQQNNQGSNR